MGATRLISALATILLLSRATMARMRTEVSRNEGLAATSPTVLRRTPLGVPGEAAVRRLQNEEGIEECTDETSVGDAESGIAIYYDEEACDRVDPQVGCNGELLFMCRGCSFKMVWCRCGGSVMCWCYMTVHADCILEVYQNWNSASCALE